MKIERLLANGTRMLLMSILVTVLACAQRGTTTQNPPQATPTRAPLILGTNLALYDTSDQVVNNLATQQLLQRMAVPIIRMPFRDSLPDAYELKALRAIQRIGAIPLVILNGPKDPSALTNDRHAITLIQEVFHSDIVYIEFGNESDLAGFGVKDYIKAWNAVIPALKAMAPTYQFAGPVTFQADPTYIATFDRYAQPRPDVNTWHEYACQPSDTDTYCMSHITDWTLHVQNTRKAVQAALGISLPLMITEWNLDAERDSRYKNPRFMETWTASALRQLSTDTIYGLTAAMQYCVTNNDDFNLIYPSNVLTPQGQAFFHTLETATATN